MRHGDAALGAPDAERRLTLQGREAVRLVAEELAGRSLQAQGIVSSPFLRARESAALVAERLRLPLLPASHALTPDADPAALVDQLVGEKKSVFWVFHQPILAEVIFMLMGFRVYPQTAGVYALRGRRHEAQDMNFEVEWML
ncbi:MAG: histidine phosphatase [Verrucomicrobia bacterium]|nr:histidine phosphatase [Verrucomicrobiota bacterium]